MSFNNIDIVKNILWISIFGFLHKVIYI